MFPCALISLHHLELKCCISPSAVFLNVAYAFCSTAGISHTCNRMFCTLRHCHGLMLVVFLIVERQYSKLTQFVILCLSILLSDRKGNENFLSAPSPHLVLFASGFKAFLMKYTLAGNNIFSRIDSYI